MRGMFLATCVLVGAAWAVGGGFPAEPARTAQDGTALEAGDRQPGDLLRDALAPKSWIVEQHSGARAVVSNTDGALSVKVGRSGTSDWHVQMYMVPADLKTPGRYTLEFVMRADTPRKIPFAVTQHAPPYRGYLGTAVSVGTEWKKYKVKFVLKELLPGRTRVPVFHVGNTTGTIWIRSMSLTGPEPAQKP